MVRELGSRALFFDLDGEDVHPTFLPFRDENRKIDGFVKRSRNGVTA
jgi:hypothetical protein